ncbi:primosomal protein N' [Ectothiorhodospiraceae bacterium 2226]|nr:primosomal protein N' [Ectothiorhodospiraceae bacterium 2226]
MPAPILRLAIPSPLRRTFDYLPPPGAAAEQLAPGVRLHVPFGRRRVVGLLLERVAESEVPAERLRPALAVLDDAPLVPPDVLALLRWAADYYHHPLGDAVATALPPLLRQARAPRVPAPQAWALTDAGRAALADPPARAAKQAALLQALARGAAAAADLDAQFENWRPTLRRLLDKGWAEAASAPARCLQGGTPAHAPPLGKAQAAAVAAVRAQAEQFGVYLLDGVTGSGKTEVYLRLIEDAVARGQQALVLVPEIGLTPQLVQRFRARLGCAIAVLHSGLAEGERLSAWQAAREGRAGVLIGTRSAIFVPLARPGLLIIDEEHDASYKQQDGFRYSARDLAIWRGRQLGIPVVLGSATPSLESLHNARVGRYRHLVLPERAGTAQPPTTRVLDIRRAVLEEGLSPPLLDALARHLNAGRQALLFLNRRGYAPLLLCHDCGWMGECARCDVSYTLHRSSGRLRCHHCGSERPVPHHCQRCGSVDLRAVGYGTQRLEPALQAHFPDVPVVRIDRDAMRRKGSLEQAFAEAAADGPRILVGTQMLAKGHHLPNVTLAAVLDADAGLFSTDFRAAERLAQLIVQVAGRSGRADAPGEFLIQTRHPDHPLLQILLRAGYGAFANQALAEREQAELPPFSHLALLRAEAPQRAAAHDFLQQAAERADAADGDGVYALGPVPAALERVAGRYRAQLLLQAAQRTPLHALLNNLIPQLEALPAARRVRWSLDVDPAET